MNALAYVFPASSRVLCRWHVRRSVHARCRGNFLSHRTLSRLYSDTSRLRGSEASRDAVKAFMSDWDYVVLADSASTYRSRWKTLQRNNRQESSLLDYLRNTWLPVREHFFAAWVNEHLHLGATETFCVKGFHAVLKIMLGVSFYRIIIHHG